MERIPIQAGSFFFYGAALLLFLSVGRTEISIYSIGVQEVLFCLQQLKNG
jgi:hypothetical protein